MHCKDNFCNLLSQYKVRKSDLLGRILSVSVWHMERVRRNMFLGEVEVQLSQYDWSQNKPTWYPLQPRVSEIPPATKTNKHSAN